MIFQLLKCLKKKEVVSRDFFFLNSGIPRFSRGRIWQPDLSSSLAGLYIPNQHVIVCSPDKIPNGDTLPEPAMAPEN